MPQYEGREIRTPNLLIWSQTRCRCAIPPMWDLLAGKVGRRAGAGQRAKYCTGALQERSLRHDGHILPRAQALAEGIS